MKKYAAPGIERKVCTSGPLGYTDFQSIYISPGLPSKDDYIIELHELCHIWLQHNRRMTKSHKENFRLWNIACDLEIARHCYDQDTQDYVALPTSIVSSGIKRSDADKYPDCLYAEEYFEKLKEKQKEEEDAVKKLLSKLWEDMREGGETGTDTDAWVGGARNVPDLIASVKKKFNELAQKHAASQQQKHVKDAVGQVPPPSLATELDRHLGRYRITAEKSYRRPPRYVPGGGLLRKGRRLEAKRPKISIYLDRSGSFTPEKTADAEQHLRQLLAHYGASISYDVLEFSDEVGKKIDHGCGTNYKAVHTSVMRDRPRIAVIITDNDHCPALDRTRDSYIIVVPVGCDRTCVGTAWPGAVEVLR